MQMKYNFVYKTELIFLLLIYYSCFFSKLTDAVTVCYLSLKKIDK